MKNVEAFQTTDGELFIEQADARVHQYEVDVCVRSEILVGLSKLEERSTKMFMLMYAKDQDMSIPIEKVVRNMSGSKLDWAKNQVCRSIEISENKHG